MNFETLWRELRLECNGEPASGIELVEFFCPRCDQRHESPRLR